MSFTQRRQPETQTGCFGRLEGGSVHRRAQVVVGIVVGEKLKRMEFVTGTGTLVTEGK